MKKLLLFLCIWGFIVSGASNVVATTYSGSLTSQLTMTSEGAWADETTMSFSVTDPDQNPTEWWYYEYTFTPVISASAGTGEIGGGGISHVTIEISEAFTSANLFDASQEVSYGFEGVDAAYLSGIGDMENALKFGGTGSQDPFTFYFYSDIAPMWGDFLAKDGAGTWAYNSAIGDNPRPEFDFTLASISTYTDAGWLLVPDTGGEPPPVPEPATMLLLGTGLIGLVGIGRRKFKKS